MSTSRPLQGLGIVITRPQGTADAFAVELAAAGARPFLFPALAIEDLEDPAPLQALLAKLGHHDLAIFVSANAVEKGLEAARKAGDWPRHLRVAAIGELTAVALRNSGFTEVISPTERFDSDALLEHPELQSVEGRNIIIFRGVGGRERLKEGLEARGARVAYAECYRRSRPDTDPAPLLAAWDRNEIQVVGVLSGETLENFVEMIGAAGRARLSATALVVPHEAIARHPDALRFGRVVLSSPGVAGITAALSTLRGQAA